MQIIERSTICLNMIVKDESHIIEKTLEMLTNQINFDYWVICDTGSIDNTPEIITNFFNKKNISGELHNDKWENFSHNRTLALNYAFNKSDYLLIFDADDSIIGNLQKNINNILLKNTINLNNSVDGYSLLFSDGNLEYSRILLINNRIKWKYRSIVHEYIECLKPNPIIIELEGDYYIVSGRSGNRSKDPNKYLNDALILKDAYYEAKEKNDSIFLRYSFYCANSYKDCGKWEEAIEWYKNTLTLDNWIQEKYICCLQIYQCYCQLNKKELGFFYLLESLKYDNQRFECIYYLINYYCSNEQYLLAYNLYLTISNYYENEYIENSKSNKDKLFVERDKGELLLPFFIILVADKIKDHPKTSQEFITLSKNTIVKMFEIIFIKKYQKFNSFYIDNLLYNLQYFIDLCISINSNFVSLFKDYLKFLDTINYNYAKNLFMSNFKKYGIDIYNQVLDNKLTILNDDIYLRYIDECKKSNNILFFTGYCNINWNYTYYTKNALGGSETAIIELTKVLPKKYNIFIVGESISEETIDNLQFVSLQSFKQLVKTNYFHTIIVSRYISFYEIFSDIKFYQSYIWAHDIKLFNYGINSNKISELDILQKWNKRINGCICQTEWHKQLFVSLYPILSDKIICINNGINFDNIIQIQKDSKKIVNQFIYTSCVERGLKRLLELWPKIIESIPNANLLVCSYNDFPRNNEEEQLQNIINNNSNSIQFIGKLQKKELYKLLGTCEYWLYPSYFQETSCITSMEMLASNIICLYYPVAGLVNTLGSYGIQISDGNEVDSILNLTNKEKGIFMRNGAEYSSKCSWNNRALEWLKILKLYEYKNNISNIIDKNTSIIKRNNIDNLLIKQTNKLNIAIFNSRWFHYEMFGYIIELCKNNNYNLTIYTQTIGELGYLNFYKNHFINNDKFYFTYKDYILYEKERYLYDYTFLITDDDPLFNKEWINQYTIILEHYYSNRVKSFCSIDVRPFINKKYNINNSYESNLVWTLPCYKGITLENRLEKINNRIDKITNLIRDIHIVSIGSEKYISEIINRLYSKKYKTVFLHIISRKIDKTRLENINQNIIIYKYENILFKEMIEIINNCDYIFVDNTTNTDHYEGKSMSGSIPLAFSFLVPLIISKQNNKFYNFENVIEFDIETDQLINLDNINIDYKKLDEEREKIISNFNNIFNNIVIKNNKLNIPKKIFMTWEINSFENDFKNLIYKWKDINPEYDLIIHTSEIRESFIKYYFNERVYNAYCKIKPGAFKTDLWSYCILYIFGGIYVDIDTLCIGNLNDFIQMQNLDNNKEVIEFISAVDFNTNPNEGQHNLTHGFMAIKPKHPIMIDCINRVVYNVENNIIPKSKLDFSACGVLGRSVNNYLDLSEESSFIGKEGLINISNNNNKIYLLKFEEKIEFIKDKETNKILLQNKNGNNDIISMYNKECEKISNSFISWVTCNDILN